MGEIASSLQPRRRGRSDADSDQPDAAAIPVTGCSARMVACTASGAGAVETKAWLLSLERQWLKAAGYSPTYPTTC
jgi:hypothetical protein